MYGMTTKQIIQHLRHYNEWRRGNNEPQPNPTEVGKVIDAACKLLEHPIRVSSVCRELTRERDKALDVLREINDWINVAAMRPRSETTPMEVADAINAWGDKIRVILEDAK
jgi:hypothetical protein